MITFLNINIVGFCSIVEELHLNLNQGCTVVIKGPNGFGKSTLFSALVWAIYGKNLKGVSEVNTWSKIRPKDYPGTKVEVFFQKDTHTYKVIRCQRYIHPIDDGAKGKDRLLFIKDNEIVSIKGKVGLQEFLVNEIGMSYNLFMSSIMFGQGLKRLIQESNTDKKKIFEEIFDVSFLNNAKSIAVEHKTKLDSNLRSISEELRLKKSELQSATDTYNELVEYEDNFNKHISQELNELLEDKKMLTDRLHDSEVDYKPDKLDKLVTKRDKYRDNIAKIKKQTRDISCISNIPLSDFVIKIYDLMVASKYPEAKEALKKVIDSLKTLDILKDKLEDAESRLTQVQDKIRKLEALHTRIENIQDDLESVEKDISKLQSKKLNKTSPKYKKAIRKLKGELAKLEGLYRPKSEEIANYQWLIDDPLSNTGIKAYLFDSSLNLINDILDRYSELLGFRIEFTIDLSSSRKDFVTLIEKEGNIVDYDELSGGEKQLCNIAMAFAMNEALTSARGLNIVFLDEVFESLSSDNIEVVISLIKGTFTNKTLFLITHHDSLPISNSKILQVDKLNGLSKYKIL